MLSDYINLKNVTRTLKFAIKKKFQDFKDLPKFGVKKSLVSHSPVFSEFQNLKKVSQMVCISKRHL